MAALQLGSSWSAGQHSAVAADTTGVHRLNDGAVNVANTAGCDITSSGAPLPPASPAFKSWYVPPQYTSAHRAAGGAK